MPRVDDFLSTPPPRERTYNVAAVGFQCEGGGEGQSSVLVELRTRDRT
jgi:hypothetical protein